MQQVRPPQQPSAPGEQPPKRRLTPLAITGLVVGGVVLAVIGGAAWRLFIQPVFFPPPASNAENPFANVTPVPTSGSTPGATSTPVNTGPVVLATGSFIDTGGVERGSGDVTIGKTSDGQYAMHLEHLDVTPGPDLHVYLSTSANPESAAQVTSGGVDLGTLSSVQGAVNVAIPASVGANLAQYKSVVIYCKSFSVIFTVAPLQFDA